MPSVSRLVASITVAAAVVTASAGVRTNVVFQPLDPNVTAPSDFWMPLWNNVPQDYCTNPRYPIVPTTGGIALDVLNQLIPNGTVPSVPAKPTNTWLKNLWGYEWNNTQDWGGVYPYPYIVWPRQNNIAMMYSGAPVNETGNRQMQVGFAKPDGVPPDHPPIHNASYPYMTMSAAWDVVLQIKNGGSPVITNLNSFGATVEFRNPQAGNKTVATLYIVKGSPFINVECDGAELALGNPSFGAPPIVQINGQNPPSAVNGTWFTLHSAQGPMHPQARMWHAYFSNAVTLTLNSPPTLPVTVTSPFTGFVQLAAGEIGDEEGTLLKKAAGTYARGAELQYDFDDTKQKATVRFAWDKQGTGKLMMLALPHHLRLLPPGTATKKTHFWCVKGNLTAVIADEWNLSYNLTTVGFGDTLATDSRMRMELRSSALLDYQLRIDNCPGDNTTYGYPGYMNMELYAYTRDLAQYADIAAVLENLGFRHHAENLTKKALSCLSYVLKRPSQAPKACPFPINNSWPPQCVRDMMDVYYDENWGGLITGWFDRFAKGWCQCDKSETDPYACRGYNYCDNPRAWDGFANYGNAFYNDHHFQYGYVVKSLAWAIYFQQTKGAKLGLNATTLHNYTKQALAFARDVANPDATKDMYFTYNRHKDAYDGHSWAEGYDYSGRILTWVNQQSGGEAVNSFYSIYLLGLALNDTNVRDWGRVNLAMEAVSVAQYQHLSNTTKDKVNQPDDLISQWGRCLSILIGNGASGATYYGPNALFQCGITILPITPFSREWISPTWSREAVQWLKWQINATGLCVFFDPLTMATNPCGGTYGPDWTGNEWRCCPTNVNYTNNQWRAYPEWFPYMYVLESQYSPAKAYAALTYPNISLPTADQPFPYINSFGDVVGYQQDLTRTAALFHVATWNRTGH